MAIKPEPEAQDPLQHLVLHGAPRSGTTWLAEIFNSAPEVCYRNQPLFSYAFKGALTERSDAQDISSFFKALRDTEDAYVLQVEAREKGILPDFPKQDATHLIYKEVRYHNILPNLLAQEEGLKAILIIRDPRAVIASFLKAPREFRADLGWRVEEEWRGAPKKNQGRAEEFFGFDRWKDAAEIFLSLRDTWPDRVRLVRYADLLRAPEETVSALFEFCGIGFGPQTQDFLAGRVEGNPEGAYSVFRAGGVHDDKWRGTLPEFIEAEIRADLAGSHLACYLDDIAP